MRFCIPEITGKYGAGLGNELIPWAKAYIASRELGAALLHPAWGRHPLRYRAYFGTSRYDWIWQRLLRKTLPCYCLSREDYLETGEVEFGAAVRTYAMRAGLERKRSFVLLTQGMWGGFLSIIKARQFVLATLYHSRGALSNLYDRQKRIDEDRLVVAVHVRLGDFRPAGEVAEYAGVFGVAIPLDWYMRVCRSLRDHFGDRIMFVLVTNGDPVEVAAFMREFDPVTTFHQEMTLCSDLLAMAEADLLVCSVSAFSMWGAFLSSAPYIWYRPNLGSRDGLLSIWGHEPDQQRPSGATSRNTRAVRQSLESVSAEDLVGRGVPVDRDGRVPPILLHRLEERLRQKRLTTDLIMYGVAVDGAPHGGRTSS